MGEQSRAENAEASMEAFHAAMADVAHDDLPRRQVRLDLGGDSLRRYSSAVEVTVEDGSASPTTVFGPTDIDVGTFVRETGQEAELVYASGARFSVQDRGSVVRGEPRFRCGEDTAHVSLVQLTGDVNVSSHGSATLTATSQERRVAYPDATAGEDGAATSVTVDVSGTRYTDQWNTLDIWDTQEWDDAGTNRYECDDVRYVVVHVTAIELQAVG